MLSALGGSTSSGRAREGSVDLLLIAGLGGFGGAIARYLIDTTSGSSPR